jgi:flavodoxin
MQHSQQLNEGLRANDLEHTIHPTLSIDTHRSKMGEDRDVCVVSFVAKDRNPAQDLMEFIEKGYEFVLDADVSSGENSDGEYFVFVEIDRTPKLAEQIKELEYGVRKLTGHRDFKFTYYNEDKEYDLTEETIKNIIPPTPKEYDGLMNRVKTESIKRFFNKTLMDNLTLDGDIITIHKPFGSSVKLRMIKEAATDAVLEGVTDPITMDQESISEIFWLTKVLGDYNINKVGNNFMFDNRGQAMLLQRVE